MTNHLYDKFNLWTHRGTIWLYSDPHFSDEEMKFFRTEYVGDEEQIKRINAKVGKYDTLIILGDIGNIECVKKLRGYKVLIMGNHDVGASKYQRKIVDNVDNHLFDEVYEGPLFISDKILLSHEPIDLPFVYNIHGHDHSGWFGCIDNHLNVCAERIAYNPVNLNRLIKSGVLANIDNIHRMTIDKRN